MAPDRRTPHADVAAAFVAALLSLALPHASALAAPAPLKPGDPMPPLRAELLSGHKIALPDSVKGFVAVLFMGFTYESRHDVEAWTRRFHRDFGADSSLRWWEVPIIGGAARLARPFIDGGMRRGTPAALHDHVITLYHDAGAWKKRMECEDANVAYLLLIDREGRVIWRGHGPLSDAAYEALATKLREARR
jgi:hypothetical protein